jgi:hypothetical protein
MKRKSFLKGTLGLAAAGALLGGGKAMAQETKAQPCEKKLAGKNKFLLGWLVAWLGNMKGDLPENELVKVIEDNGRACAERSGTLAWAKSFNGDVDKFLDAMRREIGENNARRDGDRITLIYEKCFCPLVGDLQGPHVGDIQDPVMAGNGKRLPPEYCLCTRGWTKAVYGAVAGKEVKVDLKSTIQRGDPRCLIVVDLG